MRCGGQGRLYGSITNAEIAQALEKQHGVKVVVDPKSLVYLDGIELDYVKEGLNEGFKYNNPNVKESCGCGESFHV